MLPRPLCEHRRVLLLALLQACPPSPTIEDPAEAVDAEPAVPLPLHEQLYEGEAGRASAHGDRLRLLVWLQALQPTPVQVRALVDAHTKMAAALDELRTQEALDAETEARLLLPIYTRLEAALSAGAEDDELEELAEELAVARAQLRHPAVKRVVMVRELLALSTSLTAELDEDQQEAMRHALFLLRPHADALGAPDTWELLVGEGWRDDDFASLRRLAQPEGGVGQTDLGGLFELDQGTLDPTSSLHGQRLAALLALVLAHEQLPAALEAYGAP